jgi:hypothetical protein
MMEKILKLPTEKIIYLDIDKNQLLNEDENLDENSFPYFKEILQQLLILNSESKKKI